MHTLIHIIGIFAGAWVSFVGGAFCAAGARRDDKQSDAVFYLGLLLSVISSFGVFVFGRLS